MNRYIAVSIDNSNNIHVIEFEHDKDDYWELRAAAGEVIPYTDTLSTIARVIPRKEALAHA